MRRPAVFVFSLLTALFTGACSHYQLGTGVQRDYESIFIAPINTNGLLPQATASLTTQVREAFLRDGRLHVTNTPDEADAVLTVKIGSLDRDKLTSAPQDSGLARKMGITLVTTASLHDPAGQKTWFSDRQISIERQLFTDDGSKDPTKADFLRPVQQTQAEYQLVPQFGEALANELKSAVLDTW